VIFFSIAIFVLSVAGHCSCNSTVLGFFLNQSCYSSSILNEKCASRLGKHTILLLKLSFQVDIAPLP
jgi:hypothetical protein